MEFNKEELVEMAKAGGMEIAEEALEVAAKQLAGLSLDMLGKFVNSTEITWDDMIFAASESKLKELADKIEIKL